MKHVMLDIETLGNSSNAAVVSIGACFFSPDTGMIGTSFEALINPVDAEKFGNMDASTVVWWMKQEKEARIKLFDVESVDLVTALKAFKAFLGDDNKFIWGNGSSFDCTILKNAYINAIGNESTPWKHWNERDVRTMVMLGRDLLSYDPKKDLPFVGTKHDALSDAIHQAKYVSAIYQRLTK